jgi:curli biogenesis system outer membrane secretion channel CsgG
MNRKAVIVFTMGLSFYIINFITVPGECALEIDNSIKTDSVVVLNPKIKTLEHTKVAFLPFIYNKSDGTNVQFQKTVTENYRNSFETYFIKTGFDIIDRDQIDKLLQEQQLSITGITNNDQKRLGKLLNADTIVTGQINNYDMLPTSGSESANKSGYISPIADKTYNGYIAITLKAINVDTGAILWKMNLSVTIFNMPGNSYSAYYDRALKVMCKDAVDVFNKEYEAIKSRK